MIADTAALLLVNAFFLVAGYGVTGALGWWSGRRQAAGAVGVSYLCGVASYGVAAQALYVAGASLARWQVVLVCLLFGVGGLQGLRRDGLPRTGLQSRPLAIAIGALVAVIAVDLWFQPLWAYDAWTFWTPKAHALWALGGLDARWFTQPGLTSPDYPILLPAVEAADFRFSGYATGILDLQSLLFAVAFLRAVYELSAGRANRVVLWAVLAMVTVAPSLTNQLAAAEADVPVAVLFGAGGLAGAVWLRDGSRPALLIAAVLAAGACATKVEGLVFAAALFASLGLASRRVLPVYVGAASVVAGLVPWRIWLALHHVHNQGSFSRLEAGYLYHHAARVPIAFAYVAVKMLDPRAWLLLVPLFAFAAARSFRSPLRTYAVATTLLGFAGLVVAYWSTRLGVHYQLATSARRVVTGIVLFAAALTPVLAGER